MYSFVPGPSSLLQFWPKRFGHFFPGSRPGVSRQTLSVKILFRLRNSSIEWGMVLDYRFTGRSQTKSQRLVNLSGRYRGRGTTTERAWIGCSI